MAEEFLNRIRHKDLRARVTSADRAAELIRDGMVLGMSGFTRSGEAKAVPLALAARGRAEPLKVTLMTGASLGNDLDKILAEAHVTARRIPFMSDPGLRRAINAGEVMYIDQHLSETVEQLRTCQLAPIDIAIVEAVAITETGGIVPTTSVGNSASFALLAEKVIVEINTSQSEALEGLHDIYIPSYRPTRMPIPIVAPDSRVGLPFIPVPPERIAAIVFSSKKDSSAAVDQPDGDTRAIAGHLIEFLKNEVAHSRMPHHLHPLQAGIGSIANAVLHGFIDSPFHDLTMYSEVLQIRPST